MNMVVQSMSGCDMSREDLSFISLLSPRLSTKLAFGAFINPHRKDAIARVLGECRVSHLVNAVVFTDIRNATGTPESFGQCSSLYTQPKTAFP